MTIITLDSEIYDLGIYNRVLIYGGPNTGKTTLAGTLAKKYNVVYFDLDSGAKTLARLPKEQKARIQHIPIPDRPDYPIAVETISTYLKGSKGKICYKHGKWNCLLCAKDGSPMQDVHFHGNDENTVVVIDTLTQLAQSSMFYIGENVTLEMLKKQDDDKAGYTEYRKQGKIMGDILGYIQATDKKIVCITHEIEAVLEDGTKKLVPICGTTNFSRNCAKHFDTIIYAKLVVNKLKYFSSPTYNERITASNRSGFLIEKLAEPTLENVFDLVKDSPVAITQATTKAQDKPVASAALAALQAKLKSRR
jgi:adenosyl cobinamide kinase/adenosyl cobinamide phosphate guanylyltransferase